jgi:hypothetical protein
VDRTALLRRYKQRLAGFPRHTSQVWGANVKNWRLSLALVLSFCCTASAQDDRPRQIPPSPKARKQPLLITIDLADATVKAGSAISVNVLIANKSRHPISVGWGSWIDGELVVRDNQGNESLTDLERCLRSGGACNSSSNPWGPCPTEDKQCGAIIRLPMSGGFQPLHQPPPLDPGKSYSRPVDVDRSSYDLTRLGQYTVQWQGQCLCSKTLLTSNTITLTVVP